MVHASGSVSTGHQAHGRYPCVLEACVQSCSIDQFDYDQYLVMSCMLMLNFSLEYLLVLA